MRFGEIWGGFQPKFSMRLNYNFEAHRLQGLLGPMSEDKNKIYSLVQRGYTRTPVQQQCVHTVQL